jgi:GntR family transcriptional regulator, rspAB operon transcriptional repressor
MTGKINIESEESTLFERKSLKEEIFEILHKRIISGKFTPGEWLRQEEIASQLRVSQTPVREALDLLVSSGLAERLPYRGVRVLKLSREEIIDAYVLRLLLEGTAAAASAKYRTQEQLENLYQLVEKTKALMSLNDMSTQMQLNREFHHAIVESSGNALLTKLFEVVSHQFPDWMLYEYMFRHPELLQPSLTKEFYEHKDIVDAIAAHDSEQTTKNVITHIKNLGQELITFLEIPPDLLSEKEKQIVVIPIQSNE